MSFYRLKPAAAFVLVVMLAAVCRGQAPVPQMSTRDYDATTWNGSFNVPTMNAVRDKIETLAPFGTAVIYHDQGAPTAYEAAADTDAARGTALTSAVSALASGETLVIGAGTYSGITTDLTLPSDCRVRGSGWGTVVKLADNVSGSDVAIFSNADTSSGNTGIVIEDLTLDGNNSGNTDAAKKQSGVHLTKCDECVVQNCRMQHFGRSGTDTCVGVLFIGCTDSRASGNTIIDVVDGINTQASTSVCKRLLVNDNVIESTNRDYGLTIHQCDDSIFANNQISFCSKNGIQVSWSNNNIFTGNRVSSCGRETTNTYPGINVSSVGAPTNNTFVGNQVRTATSGNQQNYGIVLSSSSTYSTLLGNDCVSAGTSGAISDSATGTVQFGNLTGNATLDATQSRNALGASAGVFPASVGGTGISALGTGVAAWLANPLSAQLRTAVSDYTGATGTLVFSGGPTISAPQFTGAVTLATGTLTVAGASLTASATWNDSGGGEVFDFLTANITDTSSAATSRLLRLRVGGVEKFKVDKAGVVTTGSDIELGHASDTTLSRASAGRLAVEGVNVVTTSSTDTLTNKTFTAPQINGLARFGTATTASALSDVLIGPSATTQYGLTIQEKASQTAAGLRIVESSDNSGNNGFEFYGSSGSVYINTSGIKRFENGATSIMPSSGLYKWSTSASNPFAGSDIGLARNGAGVLEVNSGTAGTFRDVKARTFISDSTVRLKGYTVATLPAGTTGDVAYVTDATAPTYNGALTGGGAVVVPVFYNGSAWVSH